MRKVRKNKFWIVLLICFCGVIAVTAPLLAVTSMSGEDKSSSGISNSANLSNVKTILVEDKEDVVYNDNSIQYYNEYLPSTIIFYGNDSGGIKYLINSNLGVNALKYSDLYATVSFSDKDVQSSQESLGFTADDFIDVYFDYGYVTIVQKKLDVFTDFNVRIGYVHNKDVYVDVKVILSSSIIYGFDDNDMQSSTYDHMRFWRDVKSVVNDSLYDVDGNLIDWSRVTILQERIKNGEAYTDNKFNFDAYTDEARYAQYTFKNVTLSPDCILTAPNNVGGTYEWVEVINVPHYYSVFDSIPDWNTDDVCSGWYESYTGIVMSFDFEYNAERSELYLFVIIDSEYDGLGIFEVENVDDRYIYNYQKRVLDHFNFGENPGYGADSEYGGAQGSIGWYGGEYEFIS